MSLHDYTTKHMNKDLQALSRLSSIECTAKYRVVRSQESSAETKFCLHFLFHCLAPVMPHAIIQSLYNEYKRTLMQGTSVFEQILHGLIKQTADTAWRTTSLIMYTMCIGASQETSDRKNQSKVYLSFMKLVLYGIWTGIFL